MHSYLLVRHATPVDGPDPVLSEHGRAEAGALALRLAATRLDSAWSSDYRRAAETARLVMAGRESPSLALSPLLREVEMPPSVDEPDYVEREREALARFSQSFTEWLALVRAELGEAGSGPDQTILVVGHAGMLRVLTCILLGLPVEYHWCFRFDRASLTVIERGDDMGTLTLLNDRSHLPGAE